MALSADEKKQIIADYQRSEGDVGSVEVQVALLTVDIQKLTEHFKTSKKDNHSRRGLMKKVNRRRQLLKYLKRIDTDRYQALIARLGLREVRG
jgi:small subunit ribosomal protein S15